MLTLQGILERIEQAVPSAWAEPWDNVGLQVGDGLAPVAKIGVALDICEQSLSLAEDLGCDLLVSHHPFFFEPIKKLPLHSPAGKVIFHAVRSGIALVSLHTNWDAAPEGVNPVLATLLGLASIRPLEEAENGSWGMGAVGDLPREMTLPRVVETLRKRWGLTWAKGYGLSQKAIRKVALCGGSGGSMVPQALSHGADLFVTADMKYHQIDQALSLGVNLCLVDHGEMESLSLPSLAKVVRQATGLPVHVIEAGVLPTPLISVASPALCESHKES